MEGGSLPWKTQTIVNNSPTIESYGKPLPPPPIGFAWKKNDDDSWMLHAVIATNDSETETKKTILKDPTLIEHIVMPNDTLQGICLRYHITATELRRVNMFSGNSIQCIKVLKIPLAAGAQFEPPVNGNEVLIRRFCNLTNEGESEAKVYLEDNEWDVDRAYAQWKIDESWEDEQYYINKVQQAIRDGTLVTPVAVEFLEDEATSSSTCQDDEGEDRGVSTIVAAEDSVEEPLLR